MDEWFPWINALQVGLTVTFVLLCAELLRTWYPSIKGIYKSGRPSVKWSPETWLAVGIFIGFAGNLLDNAYWGITWAYVQFGHGWGDTLLDGGPSANILTRQTFGIIAVYCHLYAALLLHNPDTNPRLRIPMKVSVASGIGITLLMLF